MTYDQALLIERIIDFTHNPSWSVVFVLTWFFIYESFSKDVLLFPESLRFQKIKFFMIIAFAVISLTQAIFGGCLIHIPQNYIAREYLGLDYWHEYGLVYREVFPTYMLPFLRLIYLIFGIFLLWRAAEVRRKFIVQYQEKLMNQ